MKWNEALAQIESPEFDANLSMFSSTKAFFRAMAADPVVLDLLVQIRESGELREEVLDRIYDLAALEIDSRYENPNDKPLTVLLWLTYYTAPEFAQIAAHYTMRAPQCWYATKLARQFIAPAPVKSENIWKEFGAREWIAGNSEPTASITSVMSYDTRFDYVPETLGRVFRSGNVDYSVGALS